MGALIVTTILLTIVPILASEEQLISRWAVGALNEGEKYGIYPTTWYDENFKGNIQLDKLNNLLEMVDAKLLGLNLEKNKEYTYQGYIVDGTREDVLTALYNIANQYELPKELTITEYDPIGYMQYRGILNGTNKGLELENPCTVEQAVVFATRIIEDIYNVTNAGAKGLMWKVSNGENQLYLLGSIHIGDTNLYPIRKVVKDAFEQSDMLIVEANVLGNQEEMNKFIQQAMYTDGTTLHDHVTQETYEKCMKVFEQYGLPGEVYIQFKPWSIANDVAVLAGSSSSSLEEGAQAATLGIDMYFMTSSLVKGKPIMELEGLAYQARLFDSLSLETQEEYLNSPLDNILEPDPNPDQNASKLVSMWKKQWYEGNISGFNSYLDSTEEEQSEFEKMLFGKRDKDMTDKLITLLESDEPGTYFVVVGAGHLVVEDMIIDQLNDKGYMIEFVE